MTVEATDTIDGLEEAWPLGTDAIPEGDNHLRLLKVVLKNIFPGAGGNGFSVPITASEAEINFLSGVTSNVQDQIDDLKVNLKAPVGTKMVFYQAAPPSGWTLDPSVTGHMLKAVTSGGGQISGTDSPDGIDVSHSHSTNSHTLVLNEIPSHSHRFYYRLEQEVEKFGGAETTISEVHNSGSYYETSSVGGNAAHSHGATSQYNKTYDFRRATVIVATKT